MTSGNSVLRAYLALGMKSFPMSKAIHEKQRETSFVPCQFSNSPRYDNDALHILALDNGVPIGTVRLVYPPAIAKFKLGRLAVRKNWRGMGIAQMLEAELDAAAREFGATHIYAGSQVPVRRFYERCGYEAVGDEFLDEGQPHIMMVKALT
jgi:predicted GNAT family N-acyltransferase